jgi:putative spermidine/putrescine transport system permease protein
VSVNGGEVPSFPPIDLSLRWYGEALKNVSFLGGLWVSVVLAVVSSVVTTPLGIMAAFSIDRGQFAGKRVVEAILLAPFLVPGIVIGISLLVASSAFDQDSAWPRLLVGHCLLVLPYSIRTVLASLGRIDPSLEEAAMTLGASRLQAIVRITLPIIRQAIVAGILFAFILSFDDAAVSLFLTDAKTGTLPLAIMAYLQFNYDPSVAAISALLILISLGGALAVERLVGLRRVVGA